MDDEYLMSAYCHIDTVRCTQVHLCQLPHAPSPTGLHLDSLTAHSLAEPEWRPSEPGDSKAAPTRTVRAAR